MNIWSIYEISTTSTVIHGMKLRGRIRKFALSQKIELLTENASDVNNVVRYALMDITSNKAVQEFITSIAPDATISLVMNGIENPVLSKLKVNNSERYKI